MAELLPLTDFLVLNVSAFLLVVTRISGLMLFGPVFSSNTLPRTFRLYLTFAIAFLITPTASIGQATAITVIDLVPLIVGELLVGLILGSFLQIIFQSLQLAGQTAGTQLGLALANVVNPQFDEQTSTTAVIYVTVASLAFFGLGGHREMIAALLETFEVLPLGLVGFQHSSYHLILQLFHEGMIFAVRVAAPVTVAMLLTEVSMGFISRTVPQLNILSIGFSLRIIVGVTVTLVSLLAAVEVFNDYISIAMLYAYEALADIAAAILQTQGADGG